MKNILSIIVATAIVTSSGCKKENPTPNLTPKPVKLSAKGSQLVSHSNVFGIELFSRVALGEQGNFMLSPLSASVALTMLLNGCESDTYSQLKATLNYPENMSIDEINGTYRSLTGQILNLDPTVNLSLANAIFYRNGVSFKQPFLNTMSSNFDAYVKGLNFSSSSALNDINGWANKNTNGKIPKVLNEISADAVMFLMNALYFKGSWSYQFKKENTSMSPFTLDNGTAVSTATMFGNVGAKCIFENSYQAVELAYGRTNFSMVVVVPSSSLNEFAHNFSIEQWSSIVDALEEQPDFGKVDVYLPKFKFSYEKVLNEQLKSMGMIDAFNPSVANLSGISAEGLFVSFVKQNTFLEVNEQGTEAAAVTTIGVYNTCLPMEFRADKPFVFAIRERTSNTLLFIGQVADPR